jgi:GNAT superfamily N-acetyltransferase
MTTFRPEIRPLVASTETIDALAALLAATVAGGGSVGFMHPLSLADARAFWTQSLEATARGERIVLGAYAGGALAGTATLILSCPPNQPHRAEIAKMMTAGAHRGRGLGKTLLTLDTAAEEGAAGLYGKLGYVRAGEIPGYALKPHGGLTATIVFWKKIPSK